jgi:hypothetical protein
MSGFAVGRWHSCHRQCETRRSNPPGDRCSFPLIERTMREKASKSPRLTINGCCSKNDKKTASSRLRSPSTADVQTLLFGPFGRTRHNRRPESLPREHLDGHGVGKCGTPVGAATRRADASSKIDALTRRSSPRHPQTQLSVWNRARHKDSQFPADCPHRTDFHFPRHRPNQRVVAQRSTAGYSDVPAYSGVLQQPGIN